MFSFRKLYADLVAEDGTVCIVYLTWLRVMGYSRFLGGVEIYGRDGNRAIFRARGAELDPPSLTPFL